MKIRNLFLYVLSIALFSINANALLTCNYTFPVKEECYKCYENYNTKPDDMSVEDYKAKKISFCENRIKQAIDAVTSQAGNDAKAVLNKDASAAIDKALQDAGGEDKPGKFDEYLLDAKTNDERIENTLAEISKISATIPNLDICFPGAKAVLQEIGAAGSKYKIDKGNSCIKHAERAKFLCSEGTSPAAENARTILTVAGPVLGAASSALNACSTAGKVANFASKLLLIAKGACLTAKTLCDNSCNGQAYTFKDSIVGAKGIKTRLDSIMSIPPNPLLGCTPEVVISIKENINTAMAKTAEIVEAEQKEVNNGSAKNLVAICNNKDKDLASFAANIASLVVAAQSANNCKKQLSAEGGGIESVQQYCEKADNVQTQFCKCQRDSTQEGCPGYVAKSNNDSSKPDNETGANIKSDGGLSSFAGGTKPGSASGSGGAGDLGSGGVAGEESTAGVAAGTNTFQGSANPGVAGGGGSRGGFGNTNGDAVAAGKPEEKKSFLGGLANSVGNMFKGLTGGGSSSKPTTTQLAEKRKEAAARKIASEKIAAEISRANGKSNWQKVREQYLSTENTLMIGQ